MSKARLFLSTLLIGVMALFSVMTSAQDSTLTYDPERRFGEVRDDQPVAFYSFSGQAGDLIVARVFALSTGMIPTMALNSPTGRQVTFVEGTRNPSTSADVLLSYRLSEDGTYSVQVGTFPGSPRGTFLLTFSGYSAQDFTEISADDFSQEILANDAPRLYRVEATSSPQTLAISGENFIAEIYDTSGVHAATISQPSALGAQVTLDGGEGAYSVLIFALSEDGTVALGASASTAPARTDGAPQPPVATQEVSAPLDGCVATGQGVNVRSGPGTEYSIVGTLNGSAQVIGVASGGWYQITVANGFVAGSVVSITGACGNLPAVSAPPTGATLTPTLAVTATPTQEGAPTATATQEGAPTLAPTATPTDAPPPTQAVPTAPPDADQHNWTVNRDSGGQFQEVISFPEGDTSDRIRMTVEGLSNQPPNNFRRFSVTMVCSGTNTGNLRWGTGGPSANTGLSCGSSISVTHTNDSNQTFFNVRITSGDPSYVTYTLIATRTD